MRREQAIGAGGVGDGIDENGLRHHADVGIESLLEELPGVAEPVS